MIEEVAVVTINQPGIMNPLCLHLTSLNISALRNTRTNKNVTNSLYFCNMFPPVIGHYRVDFSSVDTEHLLDVGQ
jgi:hypothetical protein